MRLSRRIFIERPVDSVFALVSDPHSYPDFFVGVTHWKPLSDERRVGALFRVRMRVGSIDAGGTVRVTEWKEPESIAWTGERGIRQAGRWQLSPFNDGTDLRLEIDYDLSGGPVGWLVERMAGRTVARNMWASLLAVRRLLESERSS